MPKHEVIAEQVFSAPRSAVFARMTDHNTVGRILGAKMHRIKDADGDNPNGLGSVRKVTVVPASFEETVTRFEPDTVMEYTVSKGGPIKNHLGRMQFTDTAEGCRLHYRIVFDGRIPLTGGIIAKGLQDGIRKGLAKLAREMAADAA